MEAGFQSSLEVFNPAQAAGEPWWLSLVGLPRGACSTDYLSEEGGWGGVLGREGEAQGLMAEAGLRSLTAEGNQGKVLNLMNGFEVPLWWLQ